MEDFKKADTFRLKLQFNSLMNVKIPQLSREQVDCLIMKYVFFKFQSFMYINFMNNSDRFRSFGANHSSNMCNTELQSRSRRITFSNSSKSQKKKFWLKALRLFLEYLTVKETRNMKQKGLFMV